MARPTALVYLLALAALVGFIVQDHAAASPAPVDVYRYLPAGTQVATAADITNARGRAVDAAEEAPFGQSVSTSTLNVMGDSTVGGNPAEATWDDAVTQNFRVMNTHASQHLCFAVVARASAATTCNTTCTGLGAAALTCLAATQHDGTDLAPGPLPFTYPITGKNCLCVEANAVGTTMQATRVSRPASQ